MRWSIHLLLLLSGSSLAKKSCRCAPTEACWPTSAQWRALNDSVAGQLIHDKPIAQPCYPGKYYNRRECSRIDEQYSNTTFQQLSPVGYSYPLFEDCPPVNASASGKEEGKCTLGNAPVYTVNATSADQVSKGILFAKKHNLRLVVRDTGHDILGRSQGYGSLQVWIRYLRTGIIHQKQYTPLDKCAQSTWTGEVFTIGGGYIWSDVYPEASKRNLVVVGGGTPTVGCIGGWMQGGGHSPATHAYGLGADQVLEASVVLANGTLVTASPCTNPDLFFAIRGGGGGTYGVVVRTVIKAWPTTPVVAQTLAFAPLNSSHMADFMSSLADVYAAYPSLNDGGFSGYGSWSIASPQPLFGNFTAGYVHSFATFNKSLSQSKQVAQPLIQKLRAKNGTSLYVSLTYTQVPTYDAYYKAFSGVESPAGTFSGLASRFLDARALTHSRAALLRTLNAVAGTPAEQTANTVVFATGGRVFADAHAQPVSGVNPAWRSAYLHHIVSRAYDDKTSPDDVAKIQHDITYVKQGALKRLAPDTGCYMNEADRFDPDYAVDFYGEHLQRLRRVKSAVDTDGVFYCPTCVGSAEWVVEDDGRLCRR